MTATIARKKGPRMMTTDVFVTKAQSVHGNLYDYSMADYKGTLLPVSIVCRSHGAFDQTPNSHLYNKRGCPTCAEERRLAAISKLDTASFIARSVELNGDRYSYEKIVYTGQLSKLTMTCREHGDFEQTPNGHLYGRWGCKACGNEAIGASNLLTMDQFLQMAKSFHGEAYDYSHVVYAGAMTKVLIVCRVHGPFEQVPNAHLRGSGCRLCGIDSRRLDKESFAARSREVFEREYDYSLIPDGWVPTRDRVQIICPRHGEFSTVAGEHLRGQGCAGCVESHQESLIRDLLTEAGIDFEAQWGHETLRHKKPLRFDFMLPITRTLIEYDGIFHFKVVQWSGQSREDAVAAFESGQLRDAIKTRWAAENGWRLVRISNPKSVRRDLIELGILPPQNHARKAA